MSAVIVTRGDVALGPVLAPLRVFDEVTVWDNSKRSEDLGVYGRYAAIAETTGEQIFVVDDDVSLPADSVAAIVAAYEPGTVVANMPARFRDHYPDSCLVGFGAIFDRDLPEQAITRFNKAITLRGVCPSHWTRLGLFEPWFQRTCDVVLTALTPRKLLDVPYQDREFASDDTRMWKQPGHVAERARMLDLARKVRDQVAV